MANLLLYKTRQIFCCSCLSRTFLLARNNSNCLSSPSTFTKKFANAVVNNTTSNTASANNGMTSSLRRLDIKKPQVVVSRGFCISSNKNFVNLSLQKAAHVHRTELPHGKTRVSTTLIISSNNFHSTPRRYVSPVIWMVVKPVVKLIALFGGRRFRKWYRLLPFEQKKLVLNWQRILTIMAVLTGLGAFYYISHLQETPITKRIRFIAFTDDQFMKIANFEAKLQEKMKENVFLPATHSSYIRVIKIMERLVHRNWALSNMKTQKWKVAIVDSADVNAYVLASGHVYVHVGLLNFVQNDDQLAVVLAHEIAHALLGHAAEKVSFAQIIDYTVIIVMAAIWAFMPFDGIALITQAFYEKVVEILLDKPYSRKLETEADIVGLELAAKACFDVREGSNFWRLMQFSEQLDGTEIPEWLSTHPSSVKRQELIENLIPKAISIRERYHCKPLCQDDPRNNLKRMEKIVQNLLAAQKARQNL